MDSFKSGKTLLNIDMRFGKNRPSVFEKIEKVRSIVFEAVGEMTDKEFKACLCHCRYYVLGRKKKITQKEHEILDVLLKHNLKPKRVYEWYLVYDVPESIKKKLASKSISLTNAISANAQWKNKTNNKAAEELIEYMRACIRRLTWESQ